MSRPRLAFAALAALAAAPAALAAAPTPIPVLATRANELQPAASPLYFAWTQAPSRRSTRFNAYALPLDGSSGRFMLNRRGTRGFVSGGAISGTRLVLQQRRRFDSPGDLKLYDLTRHRRSDPPRGVNTRLHEKTGSLSGEQLLFTRTRLSTSASEVILFNLRTHRAKRLDHARGRGFVEAQSVAGRYAAWIHCPRPSACRLLVYDTRAHRRLRVPDPARRAQYAAAITRAGVVYFAESRSVRCGRGLALWRYTLAGERTRLLSLPRGREVSTLSAVARPGGKTTLVYDRFRCRTGAGDIYRLDVP